MRGSARSRAKHHCIEYEGPYGHEWECEVALVSVVLVTGEIVEARELALERQAHDAGGAIAMLGDDDIRRVERRTILLLGLFL